MLVERHWDVDQVQVLEVLVIHVWDKVECSLVCWDRRRSLDGGGLVLLTQEHQQTDSWKCPDVQQVVV